MTKSLDDVKTSSHAAHNHQCGAGNRQQSILHCDWQRATSLQHRPPWSSYSVADAALYLL